jgi:hypothetical protein
MWTKSQEWAYRNGKYAEGASFVALCERIMNRKCTGVGCDLDSPCGRHSRAISVAGRYPRLVKRWGKAVHS